MSWTTGRKLVTYAHKQTRHKHQRELEPPIISQLTAAGQTIVHTTHSFIKPRDTPTNTNELGEHKRPQTEEIKCQNKRRTETETNKGGRG